ncbi:XRE family transcriptional regulator [bacterium 1xD8-6]|nr:XRE family transcriptional regulator [bacterium D16-36]RKI63770.1 XRE family transcriptional regulator [bacterium 1xD8-6]
MERIRKMLGFSEYLQNYMKTNSISMVDLSKEVDIDRTVIYRYVKGTRVPSDLNIVIRIADAIQMSVSEKRKLLREYDKLVLGESVVYSYLYIQKLLWNLEKLDIESVSMNSWRSVHELKMDASIVELKAKEEIITYLLDFFQFLSERNDTDEKILLIMQPVYDEIQRFILWNFKESNVAIEQILCMEQNVNLSYKNLEVFYEIIPLCFSLSKYDVYYYYDSLNSHILMWMIQMGMGRKQLQSLICKMGCISTMLQIIPIVPAMR